MGPVDFVFDFQDTIGRPLPPDAFAFPTLGNMTEKELGRFLGALSKIRIDIHEFDAGDGRAGFIWREGKSNSPNGTNFYVIGLNRNHSPPTRFVTVAHELAHLFLGHLGTDKGRQVTGRNLISHSLKEAEAEMTAYLVAKRNGLKPRSESYLANYQGELSELSLFGITRAANKVEVALGISAADQSKKKK